MLTAITKLLKKPTPKQHEVVKTLVHKVPLADVVQHYVDNLALATPNLTEINRELIIDRDTNSLIVVVNGVAH